jgi:hypothetical protein
VAKPCRTALARHQRHSGLTSLRATKNTGPKWSKKGSILSQQATKSCRQQQYTHRALVGQHGCCMQQPASQLRRPGHNPTSVEMLGALLLVCRRDTASATRLEQRRSCVSAAVTVMLLAAP